MKIKLIVGLGNPGKEYENTRHNFGFIALDCIQNSNEELFGAQKILFEKPQTYMNDSGKAVKKIADFYKISPEEILVLHDDLDLPLGEIRISQNSGAGGHKGVQSIIDNLGSKNFTRIRLGIKPAGNNFLVKLFKKFIPAEKFVLQKFSENEEPLVEQAAQKAKEVAKLLINEGLTTAQSKFN